MADAVRDWLARNHEAAITESYRAAYATPDPEHDELIARIGIASAAAVLGADE